MGASSSTEQQQNVSSEQREVESLAASTGSLPMLQSSFSELSKPETNTIPLDSLQKCFSLNYKGIVCEATTTKMPDSFLVLLDNVGPSIVEELFFEKGGGVNWIEFLRGYLKCCGRMPSSICLNRLLRVFAAAGEKAGVTLDLNFEGAGDNDDDFKVSGSFLPVNVIMLLWMCWSMLWDSRIRRSSKGRKDVVLSLLDVRHVVLSAVVSCSEGHDFDVWNCDASELEVQLPVGRLVTWVLTTLPTLTNCFTQFVNERLQKVVTLEDCSKPSGSSLAEAPQTNSCNTRLLTCGRAWSISLTLKGVQHEEILKPWFPSDDDRTEENLLYRSIIF